MNTGNTATATAPLAGGAIRVMVVDDSVVVRGLVSRWLDALSGIEIVASHRNGALAVADVEKSVPDVVVLDIEMPEMDGLTALPLLLKARPNLKVIMASTLTHRNAEISMRALSLGATDYIAKPEGNHGVSTSADFQRELCDKVRALGGAALARVRAPAGEARAVPARAPAATGAPAAAPAGAPAGEETFTLRRTTPGLPRILAVGSSTGGPQALLEVMGSIAPALDRVPVVITQHMPPTFTAILAKHLETATGRLCKEAEHGEVIKDGNIYVAPGGKHFLLHRVDGAVTVKLDEGPAVNFCKPAVDPMFDCVVDLYGAAALALVLTGMGSDGRDGGRRIADAGGNVVAQDKETSVVWGMPGAAAMAGICCAVLPLPQIGPRIVRFLKGVV